jgi:hypothetical protein
VRLTLHAARSLALARSSDGGGASQPVTGLGAQSVDAHVREFQASVFAQEGAAFQPPGECRRARTAPELAVERRLTHQQLPATPCQLLPGAGRHGACRRRGCSSCSSFKAARQCRRR